jgi:NADPH-dependent 2,4-dienoyl-CoA reductase/sulfur reductase-like enzyme
MEALSERGISVTLLEMGEQVMAPVDPEMASALHQEIRSHGVDLRLRTALTEVLRTETGFRVALSEGGFLQTDMVILAIGVKPENSLATGAGLAVGKRGGISVNACMQTSIPDIYAVGDAVETPDFVFQEPANFPLAGPANRQGRIAADNMLDRHSLYHGSQGTSICKVFSLSIGSVGANEKQLKVHGTRYEKVYVHAADHAGYYPGATMISLKLLFSPDTGKILGAQASGKKGLINASMSCLSHSARAYRQRSRTS